MDHTLHLGLVGVVFWLLSAYAPYILEYIFDTCQTVKKLKQKICTCIFMCYMPTMSFHDKSTCHVACVKKKKHGAKIRHFT
jgi:hypothetical protein